MAVGKSLFTESSYNKRESFSALIIKINVIFVRKKHLCKVGPIDNNDCFKVNSPLAAKWKKEANKKSNF